MFKLLTRRPLFLFRQFSNENNHLDLIKAWVEAVKTEPV